MICNNESGNSSNTDRDASLKAPSISTLNPTGLELMAISSASSHDITNRNKERALGQTKSTLTLERKTTETVSLSSLQASNKSQETRQPIKPAGFLQSFLNELSKQERKFKAKNDP